MPEAPPGGDDRDAGGRGMPPHEGGRDNQGVTGYRLAQVERHITDMRADVAGARSSSGENSHALKRLEDKIDALWKVIEKLEAAIPNKAEFLLMRLLVFGMAGSALLAVLSMVLMSSGIKKP